jgi:hypothetical protein
VAEIINLRRARKAKARKAAEEAAAANRAAHGRTKAEKTKTDAEHALSDRRLEGARRARDDAADESGDGAPSV